MIDNISLLPPRRAPRVKRFTHKYHTNDLVQFVYMSIDLVIKYLSVYSSIYSTTDARVVNEYSYSIKTLKRVLFSPCIVSL
jgi:hypothetical protein